MLISEQSMVSFYKLSLLNNDPGVQGSDTTGDDSSNVAGNISKNPTIDKRKVFVFILLVLFMISVLFFSL